MFKNKIFKFIFVVFILFFVAFVVNPKVYASSSIESDEQALTNLSTQEIVDIIIDKEFNYIYLFSDISMGINKFKVNNEYYVELVNRLDANIIIEDMISKNYLTDNEEYKLELLLNLINGEYNDNVMVNSPSVYYSRYIYTPNGSIVEHSHPSFNYLTDEEMAGIHNTNKEKISTLTDDDLIYPASEAFNCHSYAWYNQDPNLNDHWVGYPYSYIDDFSYIEVDDVRPGDIICYWAFGNYHIDESWDYGYYITHSAIVVSGTIDLDDNTTLSNINLISKWGHGGLYTHDGDECEYGTRDSEFCYVKAYRPRTNNEYTLSRYNSTINNCLSVDLSTQTEDTYAMYELDINYSQYYEFNINANSVLDVRLYDIHMQLIDIFDLNYSDNCVRFIEPLYNNEIYYLRVAYDDVEDIGAIYTEIKVPQSSDVIIGDNDILYDYTYGIEDYVYMNNISAGFYKITLNATKTSGTMEYPEACINIYEDEEKQQLLTRLETIYYVLNAETEGDSNNIIVFLEQGETYYINIDLPAYSYSSLNINIERLSNTYDIVTNNNAEEHAILDENTTAYGDFIQRLEILQAGSYTITFTHEGPQSEEDLLGQEDPHYLYYVFFREVSVPAEQFEDLNLIIPAMAVTAGNTVSFTYDLQPGIYYIGYYNKLNNEPMSISIICN